MNNEVTLAQLQEEMKKYNQRRFVMPPKGSDMGALVEASRSASILFFSDGTCTFIDKDGNEMKDSTLQSIYEWLVEDNQLYVNVD